MTVCAIYVLSLLLWILLHENRIDDKFKFKPLLKYMGIIIIIVMATLKLHVKSLHVFYNSTFVPFPVSLLK